MAHIHAKLMLQYAQDWADAGDKVEAKTPIFKVVEKENPCAVHAICPSREWAEHWLNEEAPIYCASGYFMGKTLTPDSFIVIKED